MIDVPARVRDALRDGRLRKNYRFKVLNDDGTVDFTIDNNTLVSESVRFDERMCSGDIIKFGLCEGSSLEFQYFDHPNIRGRRLYSEIEVEYEKPGVTKTLEQGDTETVTKQGKIQFFYVTTGSGTGQFKITHNGNTIGYNVWSGYSQTIMCYVGDVITAVTDIGIAYQYSSIDTYTIPMGFYEVDKCPMQFSTGIRKVTAYNKLKAEYLDAKANEIIRQIFEEGVPGCASSIDISIILEKLLNDYSIQSEYLVVENCGTFALDQSDDIIILQNYDTPNKYVLMIRKAVFLQDYPSSSYIPEDPHDYGGKDWYYTGYLRLWAPTKRMYQTIMSYNEATDHMDDRYNMYNFTTDQYDIEVGTLRQALTGASINTTKGADYFTYSASTISVRGSNTKATLSLTPDNIDIEDSYGPIVKDLKSAGGSAALGACMSIYMPTLIKEVTSSTPITRDNWGQFFTTADFQLAEQRMSDLFLITRYGVSDLNIENAHIQRRTSPVSGFEIPYSYVDKLPDVTLRELQSALFEVVCQYGQIDRVTDLFYGKDLNNRWLYPAETLYPADDLYPGGDGQITERGNKSAYSKLWTDSQGQQSFRNLIITYKSLDEEDKEKEYTMTKVVNAEGTTDYVMNDNWIFKSLVWDPEDISDYADDMVDKLQNVSWIPFEMWAAGLPYLETGDEIEITNSEGTYKSYVLQRVLKGIQNLQDAYINGTLEIF